MERICRARLEGSELPGDGAMRIVVMAGGTGPIALQCGLYDALEKDLDGIDIKVLVNAYDNGLSTGTVRRVMNGRILGPSDVRKNQTTRLRLLDPSSPWLSFLDVRFSTSPAQAATFCHAQATKLMAELRKQGRSTGSGDTLHQAIDAYFKQSRAHDVVYEDFSLANIVYAGICSCHGYSLRAAATIMAAWLGIPDNVLVNDDRSLFLGAITRRGRRVADESEIVSWGDETDSFADVFFVDEAGNEALPQLCFEAWQAIVEADLIILSSGTQWSSLIPTYASRGFKAAIRASKARVVMVMNRAPDKDGPGQSASDIIDVLVPRYFDTDRVHVVADSTGHPGMRELSPPALRKVASFTGMNLSRPADPPDKHDPARLAHAIGRVYFKSYLHSDLFLFDYDDTLRGRNNKLPKSSAFNVRALALLSTLTRVGICTGNSVRAVSLQDEGPADGKPLMVFADGGVNEYSCSVQPAHQLIRCVAPESLLATTGPHGVHALLGTLTSAGIPASKIENRGNAIIAIKPIDPLHRPALVSFVRHLVYGSDLDVRESGRTTVEIRKRSLSKIFALKHLCAGPNQPTTITYVGDECESGNDQDIRNIAAEGSGVRCLAVADPAQTAFFVSTLITMLRGDGSR